MGCLYDERDLESMNHSDVSTDDRREMMEAARRTMRYRCGVVLQILAAAAVLVWAMGWWQWNVAHGDVLRPSADVRRVYTDVDERTRTFLWNWAVAHPELCAVSAAHLRVYLRYAVIRLHGLPVRVTNPRYVPLADEPADGIAKERSVMCHEPGGYVLRRRWVAIHFLYDDGDVGGASVGTRLEGADALCAQHLVDVLDGIWPCPDSNHVLDALHLPRVPSEWVYAGDGEVASKHEPLLNVTAHNATDP